MICQYCKQIFYICLYSKQFITLTFASMEGYIVYMNKTLIYKSFGQKLRDVREKSGLTQIELAERVGLSRTSITNIEKGRQGIPLHVFIQLAGAVGVKPDELLPDKQYFIEPELFDTKIIEEKLREHEGVGWVTRVISSGLKVGSNDRKN
jgi:transcriptional regulator with XRE-family HTH domain